MACASNSGLAKGGEKVGMNRGMLNRPKDIPGLYVNKLSSSLEIIPEEKCDQMQSIKARL